MCQSYTVLIKLCAKLYSLYTHSCLQWASTKNWRHALCYWIIILRPAPRFEAIPVLNMATDMAMSMGDSNSTMEMQVMYKSALFGFFVHVERASSLLYQLWMSPTKLTVVRYDGPGQAVSG